MSRAPAKSSPPRRAAPVGSTGTFLRGIDPFFQARDPLHKTMRRLAGHLSKAKIAYAVVGGMAVYAQGYRRTTDDLDLLLTAHGLETFRRLFVPRYYEPLPLRPRRLLDPVSGVGFDILVTGLFPGNGEPGPIAYPDPAEVAETIDRIRVVDLATLVQLKLAARRLQDLADVANLIRVHNLTEAFLVQLHPALHPDYLHCLDEERREEESEIHLDQAFLARLVEAEDEPASSEPVRHQLIPGHADEKESHA